MLNIFKEKKVLKFRSFQGIAAIHAHAPFCVANCLEVNLLASKISSREKEWQLSKNVQLLV
jgi:hypothetical protein